MVSMTAQSRSCRSAGSSFGQVAQFLPVGGKVGVDLFGYRTFPRRRPVLQFLTTEADTAAPFRMIFEFTLRYHPFVRRIKLMANHSQDTQFFQALTRR